MGGYRNPLQAGLAAGAVAGLLVACANATLVRPVESGAILAETPGQGLVFGRIAVIRDGEDQLTALPAFPKEFGWVLTQLKSGKRYVVSPLTLYGAFALDLPAGTYEVTKLMYEERAGGWEGHLLARFTVQPGKLIYLGTWQIQFTNLGASSKIEGKVVDQKDEASEDLKQTYTGKLQPLTVGLLESAQEGYLSLVRPRAEQ